MAVDPERRGNRRKGLLINAIRRRGVGLLIAGWLVGLLTALVWPAVTTERATLVIDRNDVVARLSGRARAGWVVTSTNVIGDGAIVQLERPRYIAAQDQFADWIDQVGNYAQRIRYLTLSSRCGDGHPATDVNVRTTPEPERNGGGNRYSVSWTLRNDCTAQVIVNQAVVTAYRADDSVVFTFNEAQWVWIGADESGRGFTGYPGYWSAEHPARMGVYLRYGYNR